MIECVFWVAYAYLAYTYLLFPLALLVAAVLARPRYQSAWGSGAPSVSVAASFAAPSEDDPARSAAEIRKRVADLRANGYPGRLEILAVCDGPMPARSELERELNEGALPSPVLVLELPERAGKTAAQNLATRRASGEVLVFTDADTRFEKGALEAIVSPLGDPDVGCACGRLAYEDRSLESLYWHYETAIKEAEARLHSLLGANGALYAVRRRDYAELPPWALSDLVEPIYQLLQGRQTCWVPGAVALERIGAELGDTFERKRRITLRALSSLGLIMPVLDVKRRPMTAWLFVSHKLMRWFSWLPMIALYFTSLVLSLSSWYARAAVAQFLFYGYAAGVYFGLPGSELPAYVLEVMSAQLVACLQWIFGKRQSVWRPRTAPSCQGGRAGVSSR